MAAAGAITLQQCGNKQSIRGQNFDLISVISQPIHMVVAVLES